VAILRAAPEDFRVEEVPLYSPSGSGDHTFVWIEKRLRTTEEVARALARAAGVHPGDVGYAGRKDRVSVSRQWFSVPGLDPDRAGDLALEGVIVLEAARHPHKLRTGQLAGNRFEIVVRDLAEGDAAHASEALGRMERTGMSNRFGPQRFGRDGDNAERGLALLRDGRIRVDRRDARFLLSALQAAVFNEALRLRAAPLDAVEAGDVAVIHESGGLFVVEDALREGARAAAFEISATGPIFGTRVPEPVGPALERERAALRTCGIEPGAPIRTPPGVRLRGARRALRVRPTETGVTTLPGALQLRFMLPAGSFASVLLEDAFGVTGTLADTGARPALTSPGPGGNEP